MMIDRRLVARLQALKPGERLILPARYSSEMNVRNLLAAAGGSIHNVHTYTTPPTAPTHARTHNVRTSG